MLTCKNAHGQSFVWKSDILRVMLHKLWVHYFSDSKVKFKNYTRTTFAESNQILMDY